MQISLRDLYILLECARTIIRNNNPDFTMQQKENITFVTVKLISQLEDIKLTVKEDTNATL